MTDHPPELDASRPIALIGGGVIGQGWAAHLLARGRHVVLCDPNVERARVETYVERAEPALNDLGLVLDGWRRRLTVTSEVAAAVDGAGWIQENGPEAPQVKRQLLELIDSLVETHVIVASSTSGTTPTELAKACTVAPQRVIVGHPFNPVQLIPLVEVVGGEPTAPDIVPRALEFYRRVGKRPVHIRQEVPGHLANRLQAALWREAYSLVERGVATAADVDAAIAHGPGLRWALLGPLVNQHLSGGEGGLRYIFRHLGPSTQVWMNDLRDIEMTDELEKLICDGVDAELEGIDQQVLTADRDRLLVELLRAKQSTPTLP